MTASADPPSPAPATGPLSPFHSGEQSEQERNGTRSRVVRFAHRAMRDHFTSEHQAFFAELPCLFLAARDQDGHPWAELIGGRPGFLNHPNPTHLRISHGEEPRIWQQSRGLSYLQPGSDLAVMGLDFATKRRNRANGHVTQTHHNSLTFKVNQSYSNCPQHIHNHNPSAFLWTHQEASNELASHLLGQHQELISQSNTFFIASGRGSVLQDRSFGLDISHRGGPTGFVRVISATKLRFFDYSGNGMYNTVGNLRHDPRVGLLFVDFKCAQRLQIRGWATLVELDHLREDAFVEGGAARERSHPRIERAIDIDIAECVSWNHKDSDKRPR